jgi:hypothetical protein
MLMVMAIDVGGREAIKRRNSGGGGGWIEVVKKKWTQEARMFQNRAFIKQCVEV